MQTNNDESIKLIKAINQQADQCVRCGLCLNHCPTYKLTENECESPRGRLAIMKGLANDSIQPSNKLITYLDHCLTCRACEVVCPAQVHYGQAIDNVRILIESRGLRHSKLKKILGIVTTFVYQDWFSLVLKLYRKSKLQLLLRKSKVLQLMNLSRLDSYLNTTPIVLKLKNYYPPKLISQGNVALFTGCINRIMDQTTITDTIELLNSFGYGVYIPKRQTCCGALDLHSGNKESAVSHFIQNINAFESIPIQHIITCSSGCHATLQEYSQWLPRNTSKTFTSQLIDINQFLVNKVLEKDFTMNTFAKTVAIHLPCTHKNVLQQSQTIKKLLEYIPQIKLIYLKHSHCCGAAGAYMLQHPTFADALLKPVIQEILTNKVQIVVTTNLGCALHLKRKLLEIKPKIEVMHPISLLNLLKKPKK